MRWQLARWVPVVVFASSFGRTSTAEPTTDERAKLATLLRTGANAAKAQNWKGCMAALASALALDPAPRTAGDLGLCEEQAGKLVDAYDHLRRAMEAAPPKTKEEPWHSYRQASKRLLDRLALLWVTTFPREARVLVDGRPLGRADGRSFAIEPGKHRVAARLAGYEDAVQEVTIRGGDIPHVSLVLTAKPATPAPPPSALQAPGAAPRPASAPAPVRASFPCLPAWSTRGVLVPLACASAAVLLASGGTAIGFDVHATSMRGALLARGFNEETCAPGQPASASADCRELALRLRQRIDARNVTIGTGIAVGVLAMSAAVAIMVEPLGPTLKATAGPNGGGLLLEGTW